MLIRALLVLGLPVAMFFIGGSAMMHLSGRDQFPSTSAVESVPLHFRLGGYNAAEASAYWKWLGPEGRRAEREFLKLDLLFPVLGCGTMLASLFAVWTWVGRPFSSMWLVIPVAITVMLDWLENVIHFKGMDRLLEAERAQDLWIRVASTATSTKWALFFLLTCLLLALTTLMLVRSRLASD